jgi:hypothetical protein
MVDEEGTRVVVLTPKTVMTIEEALVHAAWLAMVSMREKEVEGIIRIIKPK